MTPPVRTGATDRRDAVVRMLTASPDGLSDAALATALGGSEAGVRVQTVNQLCRRMVAEGRLERVGSRPIVNRLVPPPKPARKRRTTNGTSNGASARRRTAPAAPEPVLAEPDPVPAEPEPALAEPEPVPAEPEPVPTESEPQPVLAEPDPEPVLAEPEPVPGEPDPVPAEPEPVAVGPAPTTNGSAPHAVPARDALQAWSRAVNVQAAVATWLTGRGATIRSATTDGHGPARDLVVSLDGGDVHVEVTGWPQDGARTHPTTIAGDWFSAAEQAATERRRAHPRARIVIALPDTRRYRALTRDRSAALDGARAEVWFVDPAGAVDVR